MNKVCDAEEIQSYLEGKSKPFFSRQNTTSVLLLLFLLILVLSFDLFFYPDRSITAAYVSLVLFSSVLLNKNTTFVIFNSIVIIAWIWNSMKRLPTEDMELLFLTWLSSILISLFVRVLIKKNKQLRDSHLNTIFTLAKLIDMRDPYTAYHSKNVARYSSAIAKEMKLSKKLMNQLYTGGLLHDIGKIGVPENIINKPGSLTVEEFEMIKQHTVLGYELIKDIPEIKKMGIPDMVLYHHERYDGTGYPKGLKRDEIPLVARIMAVADSFDALTTNRVYRDKVNIKDALKEIEKNKGLQFDPEVVDAFLKVALSQNFQERFGEQLTKDVS